MENHLSRNWPVWLVVAAMGFSFHWVSKSWNSGTPMISGDELSYEMPRPETYEPGYDLSGRKVVRTFDRGQRTASLGEPEAIRQPMSPPDSKKAAALAAAKKAADAKKKLAQTQKKKSTLTTRVIPGNRKGMSASNPMQTSSPKNYNNYYGGYKPKTTSQANDAQPNPDAISAAQWREILFGSPTNENAARMYSAFKKGEIDSASYYGILDELLTDSSENRQQAALAVLSTDISPAAFGLLAKHYDDSSQANLKSSIYTILKSYGTSTNLSVLSVVINSSNEVTATVATDILSETLSAQNNGTANPTGDRGGIRTPGATGSISPNQWKMFLPGLQRLGLSDNSSLAERAQSLLASIEALTTA